MVESEETDTRVAELNIKDQFPPDKLVISADRMQVSLRTVSGASKQNPFI